MLTEIEIRELYYKLDKIKEFLIEKDGTHYKLFNKFCPDISEPDSNIVEYMEDIIDLINQITKN